jgi:hypothetical protein
MVEARKVLEQVVRDLNRKHAVLRQQQEHLSQQQVDHPSLWRMKKKYNKQKKWKLRKTMSLTTCNSSSR